MLVRSCRAFAVYSEPRFTAPTRHEAQLLTVAYRVDAGDWEGDVMRETDETVDADWFTVSKLRAMRDFMPMYLETVEDCLLAGEDSGFVVK